MEGNRSFYYGLKFGVDGILAIGLFFLIAWWRFSGFDRIPLVIWGFGFLFLSVYWVLSYLRRDYMQKIPRDALDSFFSSVFTFVFTYLISVMLVVFLIPAHPSRLVLGLFFAFGLPCLSTCRYLFNRILRKRIIYTPHRILFQGAGEAGKEMAREMEKLYGNQIEIIGFLDDHKNDFSYDILGTLDEIEHIYEEYRPDSFFICISNIEEEKMLMLMDRCRAIGLPVKIVSDIFDIVAQKVTGGSQEQFPVINIQDTPVRNVQSFVKRGFDLIGSSLFLLLFSPFFLVVSVLIKWDSKGPVFYRTTRMKNRDETFEMLKFRTMYQEESGKEGGLEDEKNRRGMTVKDDPRITPVGRWLRRYSLDELPQLINVLKGDMSLVGPRPPVLPEVEGYEPWHLRRLDGWAGMTGLWQVSGRTNLEFEDMVLLDIYYLENWSLLLDFKILLKTIPAVLLGRGAN